MRAHALAETREATVVHVYNTAMISKRVHLYREKQRLSRSTVHRVPSSSTEDRPAEPFSRTNTTMVQIEGSKVSQIYFDKFDLVPGTSVLYRRLQPVTVTVNYFNYTSVRSLPVCVFITLYLLQSCLLGGGGKQWRTCATRDYEPGPVRTSLSITH